MLSWFFLDTAVPLQVALQSPKFDWDSCARTASEELLLPALANQVQLLGVEAVVPEEILNLFNTAEALNGERNRQFLTEAVHVAALLNQVGIKPVALKGLAYLLSGVYSVPATRYLADIDLLLPRAQLPAAVAHLRQHGYFENEGAHLVQFRHHHPALRRTGLAHVELHHRVGQGVCARLLPAENIISESTAVTIQGSDFLIPSPTHLANHLILHSQVAHPYFDRIFPPLRALVDLAQLQNHFGESIDWPSLAQIYRANGEFATLPLHLKHFQRILGTTNPIPTPRLGLLLSVRWYRRLVLNRYPKLRFLDPVYVVMSIFSRRLRLIPGILNRPASWPELFATLITI